MARFLNIIKTIFISFEFLSLIIIYICLYIFPSIFIELSELLLENEKEYLKYLLGVLFSFTGLTFFFAEKIQIPKDNNKILYNWKKYYYLADTVKIGILFSLLCFLIVLSIYVFPKYYGNEFLSGLSIICIVVSSISTSSLYFAKIKIREILEK